MKRTASNRPIVAHPPADSRPGNRPEALDSSTQASGGAAADSPAWSERWWVNLLAAAVLVAAASIVYYNSFAGRFLFDDLYWVGNPNIHQLWPPAHWLYPEINPGMVGGRPVVSLSLALNYAYGGYNVWGYHAVNLLIHILAALALFGLVRRTLLLPVLRPRFAAAATPIALAIALIWTVHPLQTGAVTYIIQRNESLVCLFYLMTLYCVLRGAAGVESGEWRVESDQRDAGETGDARPSVALLTSQASSLKPLCWYAAAILSCALGMATKEVMATAPLVVLLYDRTFLSGSFGRAMAARWWLYAALAATWGIIAWGLISTDFHDNSAGFGNSNFTPLSYLLTQPGVLAHYLRLAVWPSGLCIDYAWPAARTFGEIVWPGLLIVVLLGLTIWALVKRPALGFLGACFFLILAPTSSFIPIRDAAFEHRMYLPLAALISLAAIAGFAIWERGTNRQPSSRRSRRHEEPAGNLAPAIAMAGIVCAVAIALGAATAERNKDYQSDVDMWKDVVAKRPNSARAHSNLAERLLNEKREEILPQAIEQCRAAIAIDPSYVEAHINLASALITAHQFDEAKTELDSALALNQRSAAACNLMGTVYLRREGFDEAIRWFRRAIDIDPHTFLTHCNLGMALSRQGNADEAIAEYRRALEDKPDFVDALHKLIDVLMAKSRYGDAAAELRTLLVITPNDAEVHIRLGDCLDQTGHAAEAIGEWRLAAALQPSQADAPLRTAWALATSRDRAARNPRDALLMTQMMFQRTGGGDPRWLSALGAALAATGQFADAEVTLRRAIVIVERTKLAEPNNLATHAAALHKQLDCYLAETPYNGPPPWLAQ